MVTSVLISTDTADSRVLGQTVKFLLIPVSIPTWPTSLVPSRTRTIMAYKAIF